MDHLTGKIDVEFAVECLPEDIPVEGNAMASGDDSVDQAVEQQIVDQLESGNEWAWCTVRVTARIADIPVTGEDYLGCCSYASEEEFCQPGGYFNDMKDVALSDLLEKLESLALAAQSATC